MPPRLLGDPDNPNTSQWPSTAIPKLLSSSWKHKKVSQKNSKNYRRNEVRTDLWPRFFNHVSLRSRTLMTWFTIEKVAFFGQFYNNLPRIKQVNRDAAHLVSIYDLILSREPIAIMMIAPLWRVTLMRPENINDRPEKNTHIDSNRLFPSSFMGISLHKYLNNLKRLCLLCACFVLYCICIHAMMLMWLRSGHSLLITYWTSLLSLVSQGQLDRRGSLQSGRALLRLPSQLRRLLQQQHVLPRSEDKLPALVQINTGSLPA